MLSFIVFPNDGVDAQHFPPRHAFLVGGDEVPTQGTVELVDGMVRAEKQVATTVGLAVQVEVPRPDLPEHLAKLMPGGQSPSMGLLTLHTTVLPDRAQPYMLMIELARRQIMQFLNKMEDWQLSELAADHPIMQQFELARARFTDALVMHRSTRNGETARANTAAAQALALALEAGEELALVQSVRQLKQRQTGEGYKSAIAAATKARMDTPTNHAPVVAPGAGHATVAGLPAIGCAISPGGNSAANPAGADAMQRAALSCCDFVTMPMRWSDMEPVEGKYNWTPTDRWIEWAIRTAKLPVVGGPVVDFRPRSAPDWLFIWENDYETLRDLVFEHVQAVVTRYRKTVSRWTVVSGLHVNTNFKISFEQILDLTRLCVMLVKKLHPTAKLQIELQQPWGEYLVTNKRSIPPYMYAEAVLTTGLPIDAIALRMQMGHAEPGLSTRDLLSVSSMLDRFAALEKPIFVNAVGVPSSPIPPVPFVPRVGAEATDPYEPGSWRTPWSESTQANWMTQALSIICSKPYVQGVCWHELCDAPAQIAPEIPHGGLMTQDTKPKAALTRLGEVRKCMREGRSPLVLLKQA
jgi:hypothetical protein